MGICTYLQIIAIYESMRSQTQKKKKRKEKMAVSVDDNNEQFNLQAILDA